MSQITRAAANSLTASPTPPAFPALRDLKETQNIAAHYEQVNPFTNRSTRSGVYFYIKLVLGAVILFPLRLILLIPVVLLALAFLKLITFGLRNKAGASKPQPYRAWRRALLSIFRFLVRIILFIFGFYWIEETGQPDPSAPMIVAKHVSYWEPVFFASRLAMSPVSAAANSASIVGQAMLALQAILVHRESAESRKAVAEELKQRARLFMDNPGQFPPVLIFPEGTTASNAIITFKIGAFSPGVPVQPVNVSYPHAHFDLAWSGGISLPMSVFLTGCQLYNRMKVDWLPLYIPSPEEVVSPQRYAGNVRALMANTANLPVTEHGYADMVLRVEAAKLSMEANFSLTITPILERFTNLTLQGIKDMLRQFRAADIDGNGTLDFFEFCQAVRLPPSSLLRKLFDLIDTDGSGAINFQEWLLSLCLLSGTHAVPEDTVRIAFSIFDKNGDGLITSDEFCSMLHQLRPLETDEVFRALFADIDSDNSGSITFEEFFDYSRSNPLHASLLSEALYQKQLIGSPQRIIGTPDHQKTE